MILLTFEGRQGKKKLSGRYTGKGELGGCLGQNSTIRMLLVLL